MKPFPDAPPPPPPSFLSPRPPPPRILRPRLPWRHLACSAAALYFVYCSTASQPIIFPTPLFVAGVLPAYTGPHAVGTVDVEVPAAEARVVGDGARFKGSGDSAFALETVLFSLYYPAGTRAVSSHRHEEKGEKQKHHHHHPWVASPISATARGYARFARADAFLPFVDKLFEVALKVLVGGVEIPASVDVPLADVGEGRGVDQPRSAGGRNGRKGEEEEKEEEVEVEMEKVLNIVARGEGFPVVVFSHGMASSRTDYTHYAGELASRGCVVALVEHRDGSCPGTVVMRRGEADKVRLTFRADEVEYPSASVDGEGVGGEEVSIEKFKKAQLDFREAEIEEVVSVLRRINDGHGKQVRASNARGGEGRDFESWTARLNTQHMVIAGHSYGATGALQALRGGPSHRRPFHGAVILDPGKQSGRLNDDVRVPILVIHSNSWSRTTHSNRALFYGRPHFATVRDLVENANLRGAPSWFATSLGTSHPSVTDAPLLFPRLLSWTTGARIEVGEGLRQYVHVTEDFLWFLLLGEGETRGLLKEKAEFEELDEGRGFGVWRPGQGQGRGEKGKGGKGEEEEEEEEEERGEWWDWRRFWQVHVSPN
ncbi:PAF acetylhydrolase [Hypoxylon fragiforme]|uniref:PAF acetylhydrolase n=1 Tax=Hypoxylon fragiforme TaxID=63214 RepID=UPI0020C5CE24|nr:PAF acetylhydrolase [Hypoxylon fragiforme]KAI2611636.1 PAF acetylhydrolase [Hypoxylon fragiforme]